MADQGTLHELQSQLEEKDTLVAALTQRLEQAAEQLDRLRRSGADRHNRTGGGAGGSRESASEQKALLENLQESFQRWEDLKAGDAIGRIELKVSEIRDLLMTPRAIVGNPSEAPRRQGGSSEPSGSNDSGMAAWEKMKAGLLGAPQAGEAPKAKAGGPAAGEAAKPPAGEAPHPAEPAETEEPEQEIPPVEAPQPIDLDASDRDTLAAAVDLRDVYITYLIRKLRAAEARKQMPGRWSDLENVPDDLRTRLEELEKQLNQKLRMAEVELSLERARLGREANKIKQKDEQIERQIKRQGLRDADQSEESSEKDKGGRWLRMLGMGREEE